MVECVNCAKFKGCDLSSPNVNECADYTEKLTNEEWLKSLDTEELAETIAQYFYGWTTNSTPYDIILHSVVEWLKQPHIKE